jgi:Fur family zinc uptake transcriptional regulator
MHEFQDHDHARCRESLIEHADATCRARGIAFTETRRKVLEFLLEDHRPFGAYDILERLAQVGMSSKPPVAYRALGFLVENGFAHRLEKLNAYVACSHPKASHSAVFLICKACNTVAEIRPKIEIEQVIGKEAIAGFDPHETLIEVDGTCAACQKVAQ